MKYNRLLSISISVGIFLSGCSRYTQSINKEVGITPNSRPATTVKLYFAPIPNYVKHNQGLGSSKHKKAVAKSKAYIVVQLAQNADKTGSITYMIVDGDGNPGDSYSKNKTTPENAKSTLFTRPLLFEKSLSVDPLKNGEVKISGTGTDNKPYSWVSTQNTNADDDVTWDN